MSHNRDLSAAAAQIGFHNSNIGIGTDAPSETITLNHANGASIGLEYDGTENGTINVNSAAMYVRAGTGKLLILGANGTESARFDSSGNFGIKNTVAATIDAVNNAGTLVVGDGSSAEGITIYTSDSTSGELAFADGTSGSATQRGRIIYAHGDNSMRISTNGSERIRIDSSGNFGIGLTNPSEPLHVDCGAPSSSDKIIAQFQSESSRQLYVGWDDSQSTMTIGTNNNHPLCFHTNGQNTERMRIDSSGRVGIKNSSPSSQYFNDLVIGDGTSDHGITLHAGSSNSSAIAFSDATSGTGRYAGYIQYDHTTNSMRFYTNAGNERVRITSTGFTQFGGYLNETANHRINGIDQLQGNQILVVSGYQSSGGSSQDTAMFYSVNSGGSVSSNGAGLRMYKNTNTNRSINAAGTVNASGADYAEYMTKAGDFTLAKGDICGIDSEGKLTNVFANAISFVVKSTDPSYVGGDKWHETVGEEPGGYEDTRTEEEIAAAKVVYEETLESARQLVDRIAFSGQVPVNVTGATPGQHIIPTAAADGSIEGTAKAEADLTMAEYMSSVGKVIAIGDDGRAKIIVKVA